MTTDGRFRGPLAAAWSARTAESLTTLLLPADRALPVPAATDREVWDLHAGSADRPTRAALLAEAEREAALPWPVPAAHAYARYHRDGDRTEYETAVFARQDRLTRAVVAAASTGQARWYDEVADGVVGLCEQSTWCWPAHDDTRTRHGAVLPTVTDPYLDLGAGEVAGQLAWADHLLGEGLDAHYPGLRTRVRHEVRLRVLDPFLHRRDWHWLGLDGDVHNWNPWIHGNVLVAALRLEDDEARRALLVELVVEGLDRYVASLPADGAIDEGYAYWWNGACRALEALALLRHATGGALDATTVPALVATVAFPHRMHLGDGWYLNVADGPARPPADQPWDALHRAAVAVGDLDAVTHARSYRRPGQPVAGARNGLGRLLRALTDQDWLAAPPTEPPLVRDSHLDSTQVLVARSRRGSTAGLTLAVKGGHNGEHHNHNDVGSVVVALGGVPVLVDVGRPTYTAQTFGPRRYEIWTMQSGWHNVPSVAGTDQLPGRQFAARDVVVAIGDDEARWTGDLAGAYPVGAGARWERDARLRRGGAVTIADSWELPAGDATPAGRLHLVLAGEVDLGTDGGCTVRALDDAGSLRLRWDGPVAAADVEDVPLDDPMLREVWGPHLSRLTLTLRDVPTGRVTVQIEELVREGHR